MKKTRMITAVIALAVCSCQKESATNPGSPAKNPDQTLIDQVDVLTGKFIAKVEPVNPQEKTLLESVKNIIREDKRGYAEGSSNGSTEDGIIVGALFSGFQLLREIFELPAPAPITLNPNNAYDYAGQEHYMLMANMLADPSIVEVNGVIDYDAYYNYAVGTLAASHPDIGNDVHVTAALLRERVEANDPKRSASEFVNGLEISSTEKQILIWYMTAFDDAANAAQFIAYSISVENAITAANLPEVQKMRLLGTMSTCRCGIGFYAMP